MAESFDIINAPLDGSNLIEANAGTGKTWSMSSLFLRYLLETDIAFDRILVVTFTRAASHELGQRILDRLLQCHRYFSQGADADPLIEHLYTSIHDTHGNGGVETALSRLNQAIVAFDMTRIATIHGFCEAVLAGIAFTAGYDSDAELLEDPLPPLRTLVQSHWQRQMDQLDQDLVAAINPDAAMLDQLTRTLLGLMEKPYATVHRPADKPSGNMMTALRESLHSLRERWASCSQEVRAMLLGKQGLNQRYYREASIDAYLAQLMAALEPNLPAVQALESLPKRLHQTALDRACNKGVDSSDIQHEVFSQVEQIASLSEQISDEVDQTIRDMPLLILEQLRGDWQDQLKVTRRRTHHDSIRNLRELLDADDSGVLHEKINGDYGVALVDEFQDTDPDQYAIFRSLFIDRGLPVFFVGDPKQSIYRFRGADVFAYLNARDACERIYTLNHNWRSTPAMIDAVNRIYQAHEQPFLSDDIGFSASKPGGQQPEPLPATLHEARGTVNCMVLPGDDRMSRADAETRLARITAAELSALISEGLCSKRVAILVRTHDQGILMRQALAEVGVRSAQLDRSSVFESDSCRDLIRLLQSVSRPLDLGRVCAALATRLMGASAEDIHQLQRDDAKIDTMLARFATMREQWTHVGLSALINTVLQDDHRAAILLAGQDGERYLTNLHHLIDLMIEYAHRFEASPSQQLDWLVRQHQQPPLGQENSLLMLDSDRDLVQILTIHKSKGLEFDVVFCPFLWPGTDPSRLINRAGRRRPAECHDPSGQFIVDSGSEQYPQRLQQQLDEMQAEDMRLLYVAMTRAVHRLYVALAPTSGLIWSPIGRLFSGCAKVDQQLNYQDMLEKLDVLGIRCLSEVEIESSQSPGDEADVGFRSLTPERQVQSSFQINSYSAMASRLHELNRDHGRAMDESDNDDSDIQDSRESEPEPIEPMQGIDLLPPGTHSGNLVHELFEFLPSFAMRGTELSRYVEQKLPRFGQSVELSDSLARHIERILAMPIDLQQIGQDSEPMVLAQLQKHDVVAEMEFHLAMTADELSSLVSDLYPQQDSRAVIGRLVQFTHGYIDLVVCFRNRFYVIDYKTNYLGNSVSDYRPDRLQAAIAEHRYDLQYHLYSVALNRYLANHLLDYSSQSQFGGVIYLFLRGMAQQQVEADNAVPQAGIHLYRPSDSWLEQYQ